MAGHGTSGDNRIRGVTALLAALAVALLLPFAEAAEPAIKFNPRERDFRGVAVEEGDSPVYYLNGGDARWANFNFSVNGSGRADIFLLRDSVYRGELRRRLPAKRLSHAATTRASSVRGR